MVIKRLTGALFVVLSCWFIMAITVSCSNKPDPNNYIRPKRLTDEQEQIINLISTDEMQIILYDFETIDAFNTMDFWVETYKSGKLIDSRVAAINATYDSGKKIKGEFAVIINRISDYQWTLIYKEDNASGAYNTGNSNKDYNNALTVAYNSINTPIEVKDGKEIVLCVCAVEPSNKIENSDLQRFTDIDNLTGYDYLYILKCRFSI